MNTRCWGAKLFGAAANAISIPVSYTHLDVYKRQILDTDHFLYHYERFGSNLMPEIKVFELEQGE